MSIPTMSIPTTAEVVRASTILTAVVRFLWSSRDPRELLAALRVEQTPDVVAVFEAVRRALRHVSSAAPADASLSDGDPPAAGDILVRFAALPIWGKFIYPFVPEAARAVAQPAASSGDPEHVVEWRSRTERLSGAISAYDSALRALDSQDALHPRDRAGAAADARRAASRAMLAADRAELNRERVEFSAELMNWGAHKFIESGAPGWNEWGAPALELASNTRRDLGSGIASGLSLPPLIL